MKKAILKSLSVLAVSVICFGFTAKTKDGELDKITICHVPPGNPDNCHEITISMNAFQTHIDHHGDALVCHNQNELAAYQDLSTRSRLPLSIAF